MNFNSASMLPLLAAFLAYLITFVIVLRRKASTRDNVLTALPPFLFAITTSYAAMHVSQNMAHFPHLLGFAGPVHYLIGPACYFYVRSSLASDFRFKPVHLLNLLPAVIYFIELIPFYVLPASEKTEILKWWWTEGRFLQNIHYYGKTISLAIYFLLQLRLLYKYSIGVPHLSSYVKRPFVNWMIVLHAGEFLVILVSAANLASNFSLFADPYISTTFFMALWTLAVGIALLFIPEVLYGAEPMVFDQQLIGDPTLAHFLNETAFAEAPDVSRHLDRVFYKRDESSQLSYRTASTEIEDENRSGGQEGQSAGQEGLSGNDDPDDPFTEEDNPANRDLDAGESDPGKYRTSSLDEMRKRQILEKLEQVMERDQPYLNRELKLRDLAELTGIPAHHISQVINELADQNFMDFVNSHRVEEAKRILRSDAFHQLTIEGIALQSGFNSKSPFYNAFKKFTGLAPSAYAKQRNTA